VACKKKLVYPAAAPAPADTRVPRVGVPVDYEGYVCATWLLTARVYLLDTLSVPERSTGLCGAVELWSEHDILYSSTPALQHYGIQ